MGYNREVMLGEDRRLSERLHVLLPRVTVVSVGEDFDATTIVNTQSVGVNRLLLNPAVVPGHLRDVLIRPAQQMVGVGGLGVDRGGCDRLVGLLKQSQHLRGGGWLGRR